MLKAKNVMVLYVFYFILLISSSFNRGRYVKLNKNTFLKQYLETLRVVSTRSSLQIIISGRNNSPNKVTKTEIKIPDINLVACR